MTLPDIYWRKVIVLITLVCNSYINIISTKHNLPKQKQARLCQSGT